MINDPNAPTGVARTHDCLAEIRDAITPIIDTSITQLDPALAKVARYHFGGIESDQDQIKVSIQGKALRPALVTLGRPLSALPAEVREGVSVTAAAVEMVHQWSLMEDDIIDGDSVRRGRPSTWAIHGVPLTLLTADAIQAQMVRMLMRLRSSTPVEILLETILKLVSGQARELVVAQGAESTDIDKYIGVAASKTGALLSTSLALGVALQGGDDDAVEAATRAGHHLGLSWQASNDLEDIWCDSTQTGKLSGSDSQQGKSTLPVIFATEESGSTSPTTHARVPFEQVLDHSRSIEIRNRTIEFSDRELDMALAASEEIDFLGYDQSDLATLLQWIVRQSQAKYLPDRLLR
ncbi:polyprenyl synthetase family protein [Brevibacterium oceani]|uniref:polyprenyl synthetase family protein n=1 Tax=Brevibacterium oceani TaxID=358099 RepID=UPI0015E76EEE|nr:polyprenyl synthetase family protein [Brevibacterium oceani]